MINENIPTCKFLDSFYPSKLIDERLIKMFREKKSHILPDLYKIRQQFRLHRSELGRLEEKLSKAKRDNYITYNYINQQYIHFKQYIDEMETLIMFLYYFELINESEYSLSDTLIFELKLNYYALIDADIKMFPFFFGNKNNKTDKEKLTSLQYAGHYSLLL